MDEHVVTPDKTGPTRETTAPFLIRTFLKIGGHHPMRLFDDNILPTTDEQQIFTWKDATLREVLTTLRMVAPSTPEYRHPLARYSFKAVYADSTNRGRFTSKDLGTVYSRDILGEPGKIGSLLDDVGLPESSSTYMNDMTMDDTLTERKLVREERTLEKLHFSPGDYLAVAVLLPKSVTVPIGPAGEIAIKGQGATGWKDKDARGAGASGGRAPDSGWSSSLGRGGGGHWRGDSKADVPGLRGRGSGRGGRGRGDRDREDDRRVPPPRRGSPGRRDEKRSNVGGGRRSPSYSRSRSRSPARRRDRRYD